MPDQIQDYERSQDVFSRQQQDAATREQQVRDYINKTLQEYGSLQPFAGASADMAGAGRQTQISALQRLGGLSDTGWDAGSLEAQRQAVNRANDAQQGQMGSQLLEAQMGGARTGAGSSAALAAEGAKAQGQATSQNTAQRSAQSAALARRLQALGAYGSLAGAIRGGDISGQETGFQNQLQQIAGMSAARNSLANYYTNQLNASAAQNAANWQAALGAGGLAVGGAGIVSGMGNGGGPVNVGYSTDYGASNYLPSASTYTPSGSLYNPDWWNIP